MAGDGGPDKPDEAVPAPDAGENQATKSNRADEPVEVDTFLDSSDAPSRRKTLAEAFAARVAASKTDRNQPRARWYEIVGILSLIVISDISIYRAYGFAGPALLFAASPLLLWISSMRRCRGAGFWIPGGMLVVLAVKLVWCGSAILVAIGFTLLVAFAAALAGYVPFVLRVAIYAGQIVAAGYLGLQLYSRQFQFSKTLVPRGAWLTVGLPMLATAIFGSIFVLANPDVADWFGEHISRLVDAIRDFLFNSSFDAREILFWIAVLWIAVGLLRPIEYGPPFAQTTSNGNGHHEETPSDSLLYRAYRNTLATVIVLFAVYLVFEFATLWFREFPEKFYYSGYAHEGAAWLTAALAIATCVLSLVFRGGILRDARVGRLRRLAWIWSAENMILAIAVYHRLFIYIGFNGMTRMRIVGLYGISAVVVGFILVLWKIAHNRSFGWLVQRHSWTLAVAVYLLNLTPSDTLVMKYNVRRIMEGDPAPAVQITEHPINSEGILLLVPLLECDNEIIREGIGAMLADAQVDYVDEAARQDRLGWTAYQIGDHLVADRLQKTPGLQQLFRDGSSREAAYARFKEYAYQWY